MAWADFNGSNAIQKRYLATDQIDQYFARINTSGDADWYLTDHLGSVREIVDDAGATIAEADYDPFGNHVGAIDPDMDRFMFTGREYVEAMGLYYYRGRFYDPVTGRFMGEDPTSFASDDPNLYRYTENHPTFAIDPSGLDWVWPWDPNADWGDWRIGEAVGDAWEESSDVVISCVGGAVAPAIGGWAMTGGNPLGALAGGGIGCVTGVMTLPFTGDPVESAILGNVGGIMIEYWVVLPIARLFMAKNVRFVHVPGADYFKALGGK